jgi:hypothetical protein
LNKEWKEACNKAKKKVDDKAGVKKPAASMQTIIARWGCINESLHISESKD